MLNWELKPNANKQSTQPTGMQNGGRDTICNGEIIHKNLMKRKLLSIITGLRKENAIYYIYI